MTDILRVYTFGGLAIQCVDTPIKGFVSRKVEALLVYLAYRRGEHPRERLAELLWTDQPQPQALTNLRAAIASLQSQLAPYVMVTRQTMAINPEANIWLDSQALESALDGAMQQLALRGAMSRAAATTLEQALALFKGDFLAGFNVRDSREFEGWQTLERERLRGRVIEAQHQLINYCLETRQYSVGMALATRLLQLDPLWEEAHRQMMLLLARSGQRSAALAQYETCRTVLAQELGVEPDVKTKAVRARIQAGEITVTTEMKMPLHNLPVPSTPFVDRPAELERITAVLDDPACRLLTVLGPGGSGKTRLALQAAAVKLTEFTQGVFLVQLAPVQSAEFILSAILDALQISANSQDEALPQLLKYLSNRHLLLVLDNFEHVLDGVKLLLDILTHAPDVKLLVTSRERLNVQEEWIVTIDSMAYPAMLEPDLDSYNAVQLFVQSARRALPRFSLTGNEAAVVRICQLVQGMPLGIELAAAWLRAMPCQRIADEVARNLDMLQTLLRNVPERHRSMRATFEASWQLLTDTERQVLQRLSVFRGNFHQQAAQEVTGASALTLLALVDKSLLRVENGYYSLHELLRQFAAQKLARQDGETEHMKAAHGTYYAAFLSKREHRLTDNTSQEIVQEVAYEIENVRVAWEYALEQGQPDLIVAFFKPIYNYFYAQSRYYEGEGLFQRAYERLCDSGLTAQDVMPARALLLQGLMYVFLSRYDEAQAAIEQGLSVLKYDLAPWEYRIGLSGMGTILYARGRYLEASSYYERAFELFCEAGMIVEGIKMLARLSDIAIVLGEYERAKRIFDDNLPLLGKIIDSRSKMFFLTTLGDLEYKLGDFAAAKNHFSESLQMSETAHDLTGQGVALVSLGRVAHALGAFDEAISFCQKSIAICTETRNQWGKAFALAHLGRAYHAMGDDVTAQQHFLSALDICESGGIRWVMAFTLGQWSQTLLALGDDHEAVIRAMAAVEIAYEIAAIPLMLDSLVNVAPILQQRGQIADAFQLAHFVSSSPFSEFSTRERAQQLVVVLQPKVEQVETLTIDDIAERVSSLKAAI